MATTTFGSTTDAVKETLHDAAARVSDKASELGQKASAMGQNAVGAIDAKRAPLASGIESAASSLHSGADSLESTAEYLRKNKVSDMWSDIGGLVKAYPTVAIVGALVVGFAAGRMLRRG